MEKWCTYVVIVYDCLWSGRFQAIKTWAKKAARAFLLAPAHPIFTFSHWGSDWRECALESGGFHQNTSSTFRRGIPSLSHLLAPSLQSPSSTPPQTAVRPHRTASCNVLFCSCCCYSNSNKISVSSLLKWRHLYAILQTLVRVLFFCFDWLFLTCKQTPLWSSKGKDPSRQTSAPHKGRLFMHSHPLWNEESELETNKFISPSSIERVIKSSSPFNHPNLPLTRTHVECGRDKPLTALSFKKSLVWD